MINTILQGFFSIVISLTNYFLQPIYDIIANIDLGGYTIADTIALLNSYVSLLRGGLTWVANSTGLPGWLFGLLGLYMLANLSLRLAVYVIKLVLKWYRKLMP